ncbi:MAG TPA: hypothetical protein VF101_18275 [Gaiellaceae bacterium]
MTASEALEALRLSAGVDLGYFVGFSREPDGRVTWVTISKMSAELDALPVGATADDMEDAKIAAIESIFLPSDEGDRFNP